MIAAAGGVGVIFDSVIVTFPLKRANVRLQIQKRFLTVTREPVPDNSITVPPEAPPQPKIDWEREAELAAQNGVASAEKQKNYRDLSALSPAQLSWVKKNRMEPMPPGIQWHHPRFEFDRHTGLPVLWINDHCVLVTLIVFCGIGKIEANGDLFKHLRDPREEATR